MSEVTTTLVLGASENPARYSNMAIKRLRLHGRPVKAVGLKAGRVGDVPIETGLPAFENIHTVTLYLNPLHQQMYYSYILSLRPRRIIFNPGTENDELAQLAESSQIQPVEACTLVLLATGQY